MPRHSFRFKIFEILYKLRCKNDDVIGVNSMYFRDYFAIFESFYDFSVTEADYHNSGYHEPTSVNELSINRQLWFIIKPFEKTLRNVSAIRDASNLLPADFIFHFLHTSFKHHISIKHERAVNEGQSTFSSFSGFKKLGTFPLSYKMETIFSLQGLN